MRAGQIMQDENYTGFRRVFTERGIFYKIISYLVDLRMTEDEDIRKIGQYHRHRMQDDGYMDELKTMIRTTDWETYEDYKFLSDECKYLNTEHALKFSRIIASELLMLPTKDAKEQYFCQILADFHKLYAEIRPIFTEEEYLEILYLLREIHTEDNPQSSLLFVSMAYHMYEHFVDELYAISLIHGINLDKLQDDNDFRITDEIMTDEYNRGSLIIRLGGEKRFNELYNKAYNTDTHSEGQTVNSKIKHFETELSKSQLKTIKDKLVAKGMLEDMTDADWWFMFDKCNHTDIISNPLRKAKWTKKALKHSVMILIYPITKSGSDRKTPACYFFEEGVDTSKRGYNITDKTNKLPNIFKEILKGIITM